MTRTFITKNIIDNLRSTPESKQDFIAFIRIGRLFNSVAFCYQSLFDHKDKDSIVSTRQTIRAFLIMAAFLHEGFKLLKDLESTYKVEEFNKTLGEIYSKYPENCPFRKTLALVRDKMAFHFDVPVIKQMLDSLQETDEEISFYSSENGLFHGSYFDFADLLDYNFIYLKSEQDPSTYLEIGDFFKEIEKFTPDFLEKAQIFMNHLGLKLNIRDSLKFK